MSTTRFVRHFNGTDDDNRRLRLYVHALGTPDVTDTYVVGVGQSPGHLHFTAALSRETLAELHLTIGECLDATAPRPDDGKAD